MATTTTKLGLTKPAGSDAVDIAVLNSNSDKIDAAISITICTSTTRPAVPFDGQKIYETDTKKEYVYIAATTTWEQIVNTTVVNPMITSIASTTVANQAARDALFPSPVQGNGVFRSDLGFEERYYAAYNASTNPGGRTPAGWYSGQAGALVPLTPTSLGTGGGSASVSSSGLVTFSGTSVILLNGVISPAYSRYKIFLNVTSASATSATVHYFRYSTGGTATSSSLWFGAGAYWGVNGAGASGAITGGTTLPAGVTGSGYTHVSSFSEITLTKNQAMVNYVGFPNGVGGSLSYGMWNEANPSFDGFRIEQGSGTFGGTIQIFGIRN